MIIVHPGKSEYLWKIWLKGQSKDEAIRSMQLKWSWNAKTSESALKYYWTAYLLPGRLISIFQEKSFIPVFRIVSFYLLACWVCFYFSGTAGKSKFKVVIKNLEQAGDLCFDFINRNQTLNTILCLKNYSYPFKWDCFSSWWTLHLLRQVSWILKGSNLKILIRQ